MNEVQEKLQAPMPYKWRVQSFSKFKPEASVVAYIDARDVMDRLDSVFGPEGWSDSYTEYKGNLFCTITANGASKTDCGSESQVEKEKGEASDAFKRAAVKWGIGRFLYSLKIHKVKTNEKKSGGNYPYAVDDSGKRIWDLTAHLNKGKHVDKKTSVGASREEVPEDDDRGVGQPDNSKSGQGVANEKVFQAQDLEQYRTWLSKVVKTEDLDKTKKHFTDAGFTVSSAFMVDLKELFKQAEDSLNSNPVADEATDTDVFIELIPQALKSNKMVRELADSASGGLASFVSAVERNGAGIDKMPKTLHNLLNEYVQTVTGMIQ